MYSGESCKLLIGEIKWIKLDVIIAGRPDCQTTSSAVFLHTYLERWFRAFTLPGHVVRSLPLHGDARSSGGNLRLCSLRGVHVLNTWSSVAGVPSGTPRLSSCTFSIHLWCLYPCPTAILLSVCQPCFCKSVLVFWSSGSNRASGACRPSFVSF